MTQRTEIRTFGMAMLVMLAAACAHRAPRVDCDGKLQPINPPAPVRQDEAPRAPGKPGAASLRSSGSAAPVAVAEPAAGETVSDLKGPSP
jgi:hypothetical protein